MRLAALLSLLFAFPVLAEPVWQPLGTFVGLSVGGRWTNGLVLGGAGRQFTVSGAGPTAGVAGSFGWSHGALRLGGLASYELMFSSRELSATGAGPLVGTQTSGLPVSATHFFDLGPMIGAQLVDGELRGFADVALLFDLSAIELADAGVRFGLRFVPTARLGGTISLGRSSLEVWLYGSTIGTPRAGLVVGLGF